jgi:DNA-binding CsgD family transcriptional regulator
MLFDVVGAEIVDAAGQCASVDQFSSRVLQQVQRIAPCDSALLLPASPNDRPVALNREPTKVQYYRRNQDRYQAELARGRDAGLRYGAYIDVELYSFDERQRLAFFNEIIRPQRVASRIIAHLKFRGRPTATIHLCEPGRGRSRLRALDRVRRLVPLISLAYAAMQSTRGTQESPELSELTPHQCRIAQYVSSGYGNKEIAALLQISPYTIRNELSSIFRRVGVSSRARLAAIVARARLTHSDDGS